ncbi:substrate-binding domain-containing protein [Paenibacillus alkalitolerans]|uniref:substrate-binding domain-containing protein n=1 Tax=Paenibacillus alkalitolerans TaxID=2799335 RepID=UPI0018F40382|nr:substrate-binding domain-containing protein [Paenibacillus alkalitolerans]
MKRIIVLYTVLIGAFFAYFLNYHFREAAPTGWESGGLRGEIDEKYVMVTFQAGIDYWKSCLKGFEDAAQQLNVSVEYRGATHYDVNEQIKVLEQVIARKPAGIALSAIDPIALTDTINKAVDAGIPVVLFDSGAENSKAYSFLATDNYNAGVTAARKMGELLGGKGKVAVVTQPNQQNHQERTKGFKETIAAEFPGLEVVAVLDGKGDQAVSRDAVLEALKKHPDLGGVFATEANGGVGIGDAVVYYAQNKNIKIISFDTDLGTLDLVKQGVISATLAQGTWNMGYWSLLQLFHLHHMIAQDAGGAASGSGPVVPPFTDTGITIVTKENVDQFYAR